MSVTQCKQKCARIKKCISINLDQRRFRSELLNLCQQQKISDLKTTFLGSRNKTKSISDLKKKQSLNFALLRLITVFSKCKKKVNACVKKKMYALSFSLTHSKLLNFALENFDRFNGTIVSVCFHHADAFNNFHATVNATKNGVLPI